MSHVTAKCSCAHCETHLEFPIEAAGAVIACPNCGQETKLVLDEPPPPQPDQPTAAELLAAFAGPLPRTRTSIFYQAGLLFVTVMMILLPICYVALIIAAGWGV